MLSERAAWARPINPLADRDTRECASPRYLRPTVDRMPGEASYAKGMPVPDYTRIRDEPIGWPPQVRRASKREVLVARLPGGSGLRGTPPLVPHKIGRYRGVLRCLPPMG